MSSWGSPYQHVVNRSASINLLSLKRIMVRHSSQKRYVNKIWNIPQHFPSLKQKSPPHFRWLAQRLIKSNFLNSDLRQQRSSKIIKNAYPQIKVTSSWGHFQLDNKSWLIIKSLYFYEQYRWKSKYGFGQNKTIQLVSLIYLFWVTLLTYSYS